MAEWLIELIERHGYLAVAALMVLENLFPPVPSELIMTFAGFVSSQGDLHPAGVVVAGAVGSLVGMLPWYALGRQIGCARMRAWTCRHGRWLALSPSELDRAQRWFDRRGALAVFLGRLVPGLRTVISLPAGIAAMPTGTFLAWSAAGTVLWVSALTAAGYALGDRYEQALHVLNPMAKAVLIAAAAAYVWRVLWRRRGD